MSWSKSCKSCRTEISRYRNVEEIPLPAPKKSKCNMFLFLSQSPDLQRFYSVELWSTDSAHCCWSCAILRIRNDLTAIALLLIYFFHPTGLLSYCNSHSIVRWKWSRPSADEQCNVTQTQLLPLLLALPSIDDVLSFLICVDLLSHREPRLT